MTDLRPGLWCAIQARSGWELLETASLGLVLQSHRRVVPVSDGVDRVAQTA